ncbi:hypothetical protein VNO78_03630 [Psophocarpus tetragonolobus]|uniref:Uncharacterized protein n=1 Tax=Psophocarpus tetragonolobus TaxID=3891 RepID=A0AAN9T2J6_PSOTE
MWLAACVNLATFYLIGLSISDLLGFKLYLQVLASQFRFERTFSALHFHGSNHHKEDIEDQNVEGGVVEKLFGKLDEELNKVNAFYKDQVHAERFYAVKLFRHLPKLNFEMSSFLSLISKRIRYSYLNASYLWSFLSILFREDKLVADAKALKVNAGTDVDTKFPCRFQDINTNFVGPTTTILSDVTVDMGCYEEKILELFFCVRRLLLKPLFQAIEFQTEVEVGQVCINVPISESGLHK